MQRLGVPTVCDPQGPPPGTWTGLSVGWVSPIWLSAMVARGDHRLGHGAPWSAQRLGTLGVTTGQAGRRGECPDARRASGRRRVSDATRWAAWAAALQQPPVRVEALAPARGSGDRPSASVYATGSAGGLLQGGHRTAQRPDVPPGTVLQAVRAPWGMPLATAGGSGARAAAPLSRPWMARVQARVGRPGRFSVGDGKRASRDPRARSAAAGDVSWCPRPQGPRAAGACAAARAAVCQGAQVLSSVMRAGPPGQPAGIAAGDAYPVARRPQGNGTGASGPERRCVGRAVTPAPAAEAVLRARVAQALARLEARNPRGRGHKRCETGSACWPAGVALVQRDGVAHLVWVRLPPPVTSRPVRADRGQPARGDSDPQATGAVGGAAAALGTTLGRVGGRVDGPHHPRASLSRAPAVLASRRA
jgi:hypothetical protein